MSRTAMFRHFGDAFVRAATFLAIGFFFSGFVTGKASGQIIQVLKGENCSDGPVTLNEGDPPLLGARCESAGVCASSNPFAGIATIIVSQFTCSSSPVDNFAFSAAKVGNGINANAAAQSVFFGRTVGLGHGSASCITGESPPVFDPHPEGCSPRIPTPGGVSTDPCLGGSGPDPGTGSGFTNLGPDPTCSPIIVDTEGEGFHLTSAAKGVLFDIRGDGHPLQIAWTAPGSRNAFLALDRNGDGKISSGKELFGNFTAQDAVKHKNGFLALAEFDEPDQGGNGDGVIDEHDAVFSKLRLWIDENHDGISQPNELHSLPELGVYAIGLDYQLSPKHDQYGNQFRYRAKINPGERHDIRDRDSEAGRWIYDVFLTAQ